MCPGSALCVDRAVIIKAAEAGTAVLNGGGTHWGPRRVFNITGTEVELIGLNITGGSAYHVRRTCFELTHGPYATFHTLLPFACRAAGCL